MLELTQTLLFATAVIITVALGLYILVVFTARTQKSHLVRTRTSMNVPAEESASGKIDPVAVEEGQTQASPQRKSGGVLSVAGGLSWLAWGVLSTSVVLRWIATGHPPLANHYEFAVMFCWGMILFHCYFQWRYRLRTLAVFVLPIILAMLVYATTLSYQARPLMPALQNSPLLTLHVFTAALSYGAAVVSFAAALMFLLSRHDKWKGWPKAQLLDEIGYKSVIFTFPLLTIMIILGAVWANIAWGRYWSWDPKETAALVTWLIYGGYLHARVVRGWTGKRAAWLLVLGFVAIIFTYFGNLWFGGMHSYA